MSGETARDRTVFAITGNDRVHFLQGLVSNELPEPGAGLVYAALLTPQGKYLADFFLLAEDDRILLDVASSLASGLSKRLSMYKLRADVTITPTDLAVHRGLATPPAGAFADPRHPELGWRLYGDAAGNSAEIDWDAIRVAHCIPETGIELLPNETFILEANFEALHGVDFRKGCYVGQEVTARMKHKTELRKGFATVAVSGAAEPGTPITRDGKAVGTLFTRSGDAAIAYLRFDRAGENMVAGDAEVTLAAT
ncbi:MAG: folate-binding protein YgfZ [Litoreibacter sp.]|nr:folate-binding protein YgfZ [Litoreibacter sp.]